MNVNIYIYMDIYIYIYIWIYIYIYIYMDIDKLNHIIQQGRVSKEVSNSRPEFALVSISSIFWDKHLEILTAKKKVWYLKMLGNTVD